MVQPSATSLATTWLRLVDGAHGWTAFPRLVVWLCVPAFVAGIAATASAILGPIATPENPLARASASAANAVAVLFGGLGMFTSPIAALVTLLLSLSRRWRFRVVCWLWVVVFLALGMTFPAVATALRSWMVLQGVRRSV